MFDGSVAGVQGVWRRETTPGSTFEQVAGGDATLPSVSADGRYVSFTTNEGASLPAITDGSIHGGAPLREAPSVYVRDMASSAGRSGRVHARLGQRPLARRASPTNSRGPTKANSNSTRRGTAPSPPARSAITADGRTVAFVTTAQSDLAGPGTPPLQVAVRHLDTEETQLVSARFDPATGRPAVNAETGAAEPVPEEEGRYGAVWSKGVRAGASCPLPPAP